FVKIPGITAVYRWPPGSGVNEPARTAAMQERVFEKWRTALSAQEYVAVMRRAELNDERSRAQLQLQAHLRVQDEDLARLRPQMGIQEQQLKELRTHLREQEEELARLRPCVAEQEAQLQALRMHCEQQDKELEKLRQVGDAQQLELNNAR